MKYSVKSPQKGALTHFLSTFASMKTLTDTEYIHALIAEGEHQQQDFKFEISDARKIAKTLSAFANTDGGKLLIGVKDNGKIAGVRSDEEQYMIEAAAGLYCSPEVNYTMQTYQVEGWWYKSRKVTGSRYMPRTKRENILPISVSRMKTSLPLPSIYVSGNKAKVRKEN